MMEKFCPSCLLRNFLHSKGNFKLVNIVQQLHSFQIDFEMEVPSFLTWFQSQALCFILHPNPHFYLQLYSFLVFFSSWALGKSFCLMGPCQAPSSLFHGLLFLFSRVLVMDSCEVYSGFMRSS